MRPNDSSDDRDHGRNRPGRRPRLPWFYSNWFLASLVGLLALLVCGCIFFFVQNLMPRGGPPSNAAVVNLTANTSLRPWLEAVTRRFNASGVKTSNGKPVYVVLQSAEAGQTVRDLSGGGPPPAMWIPDDKVWADVLADQGNPGFQNDCVSVAHSPLVIAMWQPLAESLGWPGRSLGWLDVGSLAADATAWQYYSGGQFGPSLRLGHTHPGLSASGAFTLLALVQAAQSKTEAVTVEEVQFPIVKASVGAFESAVSWFSKSTDSLGETMQARGSSYLGAAVMYESVVVHYGAGSLVPIYPFEGTFMATHPACVNESADPATQEAARLFRDDLMGETAQQAALANGLRPVNSAVPLASPLDAAHGVDVSQPGAVFAPPSVATIYAMQDIWQAARKNVNLVMLIDTSGSMQGDKIANVRTAAAQFVRQMGDNDYITLIAFASSPSAIIVHEQVGAARDQIVAAIDALRASGNTTLYDAIAHGATFIAGTTSPQTTNAMVVLSDGLDTGSTSYGFDQALFDLAAANDTTIFTIAYGGDADKDLMSGLAQQTHGNYYLGDEASIAAIYDEMSAAFGGGAGVGR